MIGAKTISSLVVLIATLWVAHASGVLAPETLLAMGDVTTFWVALFAVISGTAVFSFWRVGEPSRHYYRFSASGSLWEDEAHFVGTSGVRLVVGTNPGDAFDLSPHVHHAIYIVLAFIVGLITLDARALSVLSGVAQNLASPAGQFCPEEGEEAAAAPGEDNDVPGCALIKRAFELGYTTTLGDCGVKKKGKAATTLCHLRQRDEPVLHFASRLLRDAFEVARAGMQPDALAHVKRDFETKLENLETLGVVQRQVMTVAPRSSHHVFTNLVEPDHGLFAEERCLERFRILPHRPPDGRLELLPSRVLEHVVGKLLFESRYMPASAFCPEFIIHWGSSPDVCSRLHQEPTRTLEETGAREHVASALGRKALAKDIDAMHALLAGGKAEDMLHTMRDYAPQKFVSFACYIEEERDAPSQMTHAITYGADTFEVRELRVPTTDPDPHGLYVERYKQIAALLGGGFQYDALLSEAAIDSKAPADALARAFRGGDFALTRLDTLRGVDVFVTPDVLTRDDLLDVYPYYVHLQNFVRIFRKHYARDRGRL